ncbi:16S rRNA (guanine(527)-N(7))-methyltransferase RsmG [Xanthobacter agilis]|uniref:Ribosomal RNA small subunit methyltransferase G n=1 Tax=Xanthobacter agilis TaxID=47492 RepID=A0ABU0LFA4_XANAG|nr:16S rRNA (guanine(527)-N(7))-methyltransferase RsmG [Xanthobacter agilis]MDQ0505757.1 16S rRNA (guanine527-N7)-methyltransferase [Xanthobacter agilis]
MDGAILERRAQVARDVADDTEVVSQRRGVEASVSRETFQRLDALVGLLLKWQRTINLVAPATLPQVWARHVADSLQLVALAPTDATRWVDLGSGGGFPGLVVAAVLAERSGAAVDLVESDSRKAAFLREAIRVIGLPGRVHVARIEKVGAELAGGTHVVSARALAPLPKLLDLAAPFLAAGAVGLFLKGKDATGELTEARKGWTLDVELAPSHTDPDGRIVVVKSARPLAAAAHARSSARERPDAAG